MSLYDITGHNMTKNEKMQQYNMCPPPSINLQSNNRLQVSWCVCPPPLSKVDNKLWIIVLNLLETCAKSLLVDDITTHLTTLFSKISF